MAARAPAAKRTAEPAAASGGAIRAVVGSDESEVKRAARELAQQLTPPESGEFGTEIIDGCADNADAAVSRVNQTIEALLTLPFFGGGKLVWLKSANFMGDTPAGRAASVIDALAKLSDILSRGLPPDVTFLLS